MASCQDIEDLDVSCGFKRPMPGVPTGSVDEYSRHWFVHVKTDCSAGHWPHKWVDLLVDPAGIAFKEQLAEHKKKLQVKVSICSQDIESRSALKASASSAPFAAPDQGLVLYIYPESRKVTLQTEADVTSFFSEIGSGPALWSFAHSFVSSPQVFVCIHQAVDGRCGFCGPKLMQQFRDHVPANTIWGISHVGGHKWAGNVIIASVVSVDWFGYVTPEVVPKLVSYITAPITEETLPGISSLAPNFRGRMTLKPEEQKTFFTTILS